MSTEMQSGLDELVSVFKAQHMRENPGDDTEMTLNAFLYEIQKSGNDLSSWSEDEWWEALRRFGFDEEDIPDALENVAGWGVVDNFVWALPESAEAVQLVDDDDD